MKFYVKKMSRRRSRSIRQPPGATTCCFCGFSEDDEVEYGKLYTHNGIVTHYYCLLLSSNMEQNGNDNEGILGFMPTDIQKELRRGKRLSCTHCKRTGATLGCCNSRCKKVFHLPCGLRAGSLHQFFGEFRSYCITHRIKQEIDEHIKAEAAAAGTVTCYICYEEVNPQNTIRTLWAPCCRKNAWFHRKCVQRLALSAGYFFKCPLCNNKQEFQQAMLEHGIFIPNQDASWELVPNAYQELLHRHSRCDAIECLCPKGRSHTGVNAKWELVLCRLCGSQGVHKACGHIKLASSMWECAECVGMLRKTDKSSARTNQLRKVANDEISEDESSSSSDISVGRNPSPLPVTERPLSPPPITITSPIKLRPGPRSFKLQQAVQNAKSKELRAQTGTSNTFVQENTDILLSSRSDINESLLSNEKSNGEALEVKYFNVEASPMLTKSTSMETKTTSMEPKSTSMETNNTLSQSDDSNNLLKRALTKPIESRRRVAEIILIDSDDEVEILSVKPKQNVLTTNDGTQIPIHSLYQVSAELQKAEGDVKVANCMPSEVSKSLPCQSKSIPVTKSIIVSDTASLSSICGQTSTLTPLLHPSNIPKSPIAGRNRIGITVGKASGNSKDPDLFLVTEIPNQNSVMNLKITNVTSVREEDFASTFEEPNVMEKIDTTNICIGGGRSDLPLNVKQQVNIYPITGIPKSGTTVFQPRTFASKDLNVKRKSEEHAEKSSYNLSNTEEILENHKRARTYECTNSRTIPKSTNMPWSINLNDVNGAIPIIATSISLTCSSNSNRLEQSTASLQVKPKQLQNDSNSKMRIIFNPDIQNKTGSSKYPPGTSLASSVHSKTKKNRKHQKLPNNEPSHIGSQDYFMHFPKVTKTYSSVHAQKANKLSPKNLGQNSTNINGTTDSNQKFTANGSQSLPEISPGSSKPGTLTEEASKSSESVPVRSNSVYQSHKNVNREIQRYSESGQTLQTNPSTPDVIFHNGLPRNRTEIPTGSNGNQPNVNNMLKTNQSITQLANGIPIPSGCDGDAGSSPAAEAGFTRQATSRSPVQSPTESITFTNTDATSDREQSTNANTSIPTCVSANPTNIQHHFSSTITRKYCDKPRLIPNKVPFRNLKFRILDPKIVQIVVYDTFMINVSADTGNLQKIRDAVNPRCNSIKEDEMLSSFTQQSDSLSTKCDVTGNHHNINICKEHALPEVQDCSKIAGTQKEFLSVTESLLNPVVSELKFDSKYISNTAISTDSKNKASCVLETKCNIGNKISESCMNQTSLPGKESYYHVQKMESSTNDSLNCACLKSNDKSSFCMQHKENLSKENTICSAISNNASNLKNLCERDDNIMYINKCKGFSGEFKQSSLKKVAYKNSVRSASSIDFCNKTHNYLNDKDEKKRSIRRNSVSKCLVKSLDDSSESHLSIDCYNNFKKIIDRNSELNFNIKDLDANTQDSLKIRDTKVVDLSGTNGINKVSANSNAANSNKCFDNTNLIESKSQAVDTKYISSNSKAVLSSQNINGDIFLKKPMNAAFNNQISSLIDVNKSSMSESGFGIKVRIELNRIQHLIDEKPQLFSKRSYAKIKRKNEAGFVRLPILEKSQNFFTPGSNNCLYFSKLRTRQCVQNTDKSPARKKLKYNSEFFEDHSNR